MTSFPEFRALVHVLVEPLVADGQMEFLDEKGELGMEGSEEGKYPLKKLNGHEIVGEVKAFEIIDPTSEEGVKAIDRVCGGRIHCKKKKKQS